MAVSDVKYRGPLIRKAARRSRRVAFVTGSRGSGREAPGLSADNQLVAEALVGLRVAPRAVAWESALDLRSDGLVVPLQAYRSYRETVLARPPVVDLLDAAGAPVLNDPDVIRVSDDREAFFKVLEHAGVEFPDLEVVHAGDARSLRAVLESHGWPDGLVSPAGAAAERGAFLVGHPDSNASLNLRALPDFANSTLAGISRSAALDTALMALKTWGGVVVQEYQPSQTEPGICSAVYLASPGEPLKHSHAFWQDSQRPGVFAATDPATNVHPSPDVLQELDKVARAVSDRFKGRIGYLVIQWTESSESGGKIQLRGLNAYNADLHVRTSEGAPERVARTFVDWLNAATPAAHA